MRQILQHSHALHAPLVPHLEVSENEVTLKIFYDVFSGHSPLEQNHPDLLTVHNFDSFDENSNPFTKHRIDYNEEVSRTIIKGDAFSPTYTVFRDEIGNRYFKFAGGSTIKRTQELRYNYDTEQEEITTVIKFATTTFSNSSSVPGYKMEEVTEWHDNALFCFDYNFSGYGCFLPYNISSETYNSKINYVRHAENQNFVFRPEVGSQLTVGTDTSITYTSNEFKRRIMGMYFFDKTQSFEQASFYMYCYGNYGMSLNANLHGQFIGTPQEEMLTDYSKLPRPKIQVLSSYEIQRDNVSRVVISLYDSDFYMLAEDGDNIVMENSYERLQLEDPEDLTTSEGTISEQYLIDSNTEIYLKHNAGYLSKNKVKLNQGRGEAIIRALDLEYGDDITIKAGYKSFSNSDSHKLKVII